MDVNDVVDFANGVPPHFLVSGRPRVGNAVKRG